MINNIFPKVILIHGNGGSTVNDNWFPWVRDNLTEMGFRVISETFPDNKLARKEIWLPFLKDDLKADENTILIGHSSGGLAAMRFAQENKIYGSIIIGVSYTDLGDESEKLSGFFDDPWDWNKISKNQNWIVQFASVDDPYIPIEEARYVHEKINSEYYEYTNRGHFSWDKKAKEFPEIINVIKDKFKIKNLSKLG